MEETGGLHPKLLSVQREENRGTRLAVINDRNIRVNSAPEQLSCEVRQRPLVTVFVVTHANRVRRQRHQQAGVVDDLNELNEGELAELRGVEEDARADAEEKLARVEAVAAAAFTRAEEMQRRVNKIM